MASEIEKEPGFWPLVDDLTIVYFETTPEKINVDLARAMEFYSELPDHGYRIDGTDDKALLMRRPGKWKAWEPVGYAFTISPSTSNVMELRLPEDLRDEYASKLIEVLQKAGRVPSEENEGDEPMPPTELIYTLRTVSPAMISLALWLTVKEVLPSA